MTLQTIETQYMGYRFRSRLEARYAVLFDALGMAYEYEKEGYDLGHAGYYLPDFWLPQPQAWVEIKGDEPSASDRAKIDALARGTRHPVWTLVGMPGADWGHPCVSVFQPLDDPEGRYGPSMTREWYQTQALQDPDDFGGLAHVQQALVDGGLVWHMCVSVWQGPATCAAPLVTCTQRAFTRAVDAMRAARFEYGETPDLRG
jgi:hypothetical protein